MGLVDKSNLAGATKTRYLSAGGKIMKEGDKPTGVFIESVPEGTVYSVRRVNKVGREVYEVFYNSQLTGRLINTEIVPNNYDKQLSIKITIVDSTYSRWQLEMPVRSAHGRSFLAVMYNLNPGYEISIEPVFFVGTNRDTNTPKNVSYLNFFHIDENGATSKVEPWFTNDNPGHVPALIDTVYQGKSVKDDTARVDYLVRAHQQWSQSLFSEEKMRVVEFRQKQAAEKSGNPQRKYTQPQYAQPAMQQDFQQLQPQQYQQPPAAPAPQQYSVPVQQPPQSVFAPPVMPAQTNRPPGAPTPPQATQSAPQPQMMRPPVITAPQVPQQGQGDWPAQDDDDLSLPF
jgi:hypothetical protein